MSEFYIYVYLREDGSPYYVGKGKGNRAWKKSGRRCPPPADSSRIVIVKESLTETEALTEEIRLIQLHGRKDKGTGCLRNLTDGGDGVSGYIPSAESRAKQSAAITGKKVTPETRAKMSAAHQNMSPETLAKRSAKMSAAQSGEKNHMYGKTGEQCPNYGKKHTPEARAKISAANTGENHPMYGMSGEHNPMYGKPNPPSEETKAKRLATRKRNREAKDLLQHQ